MADADADAVVATAVSLLFANYTVVAEIVIVSVYRVPFVNVQHMSSYFAFVVVVVVVVIVVVTANKLEVLSTA